MISVIEVSHIYKKYKIGESPPYFTLRDAISGILQSPFRKKRETLEEDEFWALRNITFSIKQGEIVGVVGSNGAGKSTMLKTLCRITAPTRGKIILTGSVASLLDVGTGFQSELTGRENIFLNGAILGMDRNEVKCKFRDIVAFSELEKFLDTPFKYYSSGMFVRLGFAIAAYLNSEILIFDEVLAAGDDAFQKKAVNKMKELQSNGKTIIFVSHNMDLLQSLCKRVICLHKGVIEADGETRQIIQYYLEHNYQ